VIVIVPLTGSAWYPVRVNVACVGYTATFVGAVVGLAVPEYVTVAGVPLVIPGPVTVAVTPCGEPLYTYTGLGRLIVAISGLMVTVPEPVTSTAPAPLDGT
jgi:hypothetical protein